jgi:hypothetical protein
MVPPPLGNAAWGHGFLRAPHLDYLPIGPLAGTAGKAKSAIDLAQKALNTIMIWLASISIRCVVQDLLAEEGRSV